MTPEQYAEYRDHAEAHALTLEANSNAADTLAALDEGKTRQTVEIVNKPAIPAEKE